MCSHEGVTLQRVMAQSSLYSSLMKTQAYIVVLKNKSQSPQTECGVDEPPVCDMCSLDIV